MVRADLQEVTFDTLAYGGEALGRLADGRAVFVPYGLPGERARVRLVQEKRGFARAELVELIQPAAARITPRCKHFGVCGGCHYQHMPYERQLEVKAEILRDQLQRIGRLEDPPVQATVPSTNPWNYRNQVQFHLTREGRLGYVRASSDPSMPQTIFAVEECHLPEQAINQIWPQLLFEGDSGVQRVSIRAGADDDLMLVLEGSRGELPELEIEGELSVTHLFQDDCVLISGRDHVGMRVLERDFRVSAPSFFQVNTAMAEKMVEHVLELAPSAADIMFDVYCGVGLFSAFLGPRCKRLVGIEVAAAACEDFGVNLDEFDNVELYEAPAEDVLPTLEVKPDLVIVDPPRAGVELKALDALVQLEPARIIYVSCDPSTLARDVRRLTDNDFRLIRVTPFDMFPQTYHIESISVLDRA
jgi:23S rRNA (uracil1939-C5)-methyltransferase